MPTTSVLNMFASSPIKPLQKHMAQALKATELVHDFFLALVDQHWKKAAALQKKISDAEHKADALKRDLRIHLPKGLFMSMPRSDVLAALKSQEKLVNLAKDVSGLALGRRIVLPEEMVADFLIYTQTVTDVARQAHKAIVEVGELMEVGFRGKEAEHIEHTIDKLDSMESDSDRQQVDLRSALFDLEAQMPPIEVMFLYSVIEKVGELADCAQEIGGRVILLLAE